MYFRVHWEHLVAPFADGGMGGAPFGDNKLAVAFHRVLRAFHSPHEFPEDLKAARALMPNMIPRLALAEAAASEVHRQAQAQAQGTAQELIPRLALTEAAATEARRQAQAQPQAQGAAQARHQNPTQTLPTPPAMAPSPPPERTPPAPPPARTSGGMVGGFSGGMNDCRVKLQALFDSCVEPPGLTLEACAEHLREYNRGQIGDQIDQMRSEGALYSTTNSDTCWMSAIHPAYVPADDIVEIYFDWESSWAE